MVYSLWSYLKIQGIVVIFLSLIQVLFYTSDSTKIGPLIAIMLISPLYIFTLKVFLIDPVVNQIEKKLLRQNELFEDI